MNYLRQQKGLTLIEILAAIVISSIIGIILLNILFSSNKQYNSQVSKSANLNELSFISKQLTKDFRKSKNVAIATNNVKFYSEATSTTPSANYTYSSGTGKLNRNNSEYATKLTKFCVVKTDSTMQKTATTDCTDEDKNKLSNTSQAIYIYIKNSDGRKVETTLFSRGGS